MGNINTKKQTTDIESQDEIKTQSKITEFFKTVT